MLELFGQGLLTILSPQTLAFMVIGTAVGIVFGAVPGLTSVMAVVLFLPITYGMPVGMGLATLIALYIGSTSGGLISAILLKIPGTPASVATCFEGHPMVEKGEGFKALGVGIVFSFIGTLISLAALIFISPPLAKIALKFGPHEYFSLGIFALTLIATLSTGSMVKGLFSGALGIAFSTVGIAPIDAVTRYTFGKVELSSGFNTLTVLVGIFAIAEVIKTAENVRHEGDAEVAKVDKSKMKGFGFSLKEFKEQIPNSIRSSLLGIGIGILPGIGGSTSNLISYLVAKKRSKHPEKFGTGIVDGIVASESANNASIGGALIPLLTLGIPGDGVTAILLGGFMVHGIAPGPMLFVNQGPLVYTIFAAVFIATILMLVVEFGGLRIFIKLLSVPKHILIPIIFSLCVVGAFGLNNRVFDIWTILIFGLVGYVFVKFAVPQAPFIIGFILGPTVETNLRRGLQLSENGFMGFLTNPISGVLLALTVLSIAWTVFSAFHGKGKKIGVEA